MPGRKNGTKGPVRGSTGLGRPMGHGGGSRHEGQDGEIGQHRDATPNSTDPGAGQSGHGRSDSSPGHVKQAAGAQSARDYAPGRMGQAGASGEEGAAGRSRRGTILAEVAPDEVGQD